MREFKYYLINLLSIIFGFLSIACTSSDIGYSNKEKLQDSEVGVKIFFDNNYNMPGRDLWPYDDSPKPCFKESKTFINEWTDLKTGKNLAEKNLADVEWSDVQAEEGKPMITCRGENQSVVCNTYREEDELNVSVSGKNITIKNLAYNITWNDNPDVNYSNHVIFVSECQSLTIENLYIVQENSASDGIMGDESIRIHDCDEVIIRNSYFEGLIDGHHVTLKGVSKSLIELNEFVGKELNDNEWWSGGGISIDGGAGDPNDSSSLNYKYEDGSYEFIGDPSYCKYEMKVPGLCTENPREPKCTIVQHNYIHDFYGTSQTENYDAISAASPGDMLVFNNSVENWGFVPDATSEDQNCADGMYDLGHRRYNDANYNSRAIWVKRNIFSNGMAKTTGRSDDTNYILFSNNMYQNFDFISTYHTHYDVYHYNEFFFNPRVALLKLWGDTSEGHIYMMQNFIYSSSDDELYMYYVSGEATHEGYKTFLNANYNTYMLSNRKIYWIHENGELCADESCTSISISNFNTWIQEKDKKSTYSGSSKY